MWCVFLFGVAFVLELDDTVWNIFSCKISTISNYWITKVKFEGVFECSVWGAATVGTAQPGLFTHKTQLLLSFIDLCSCSSTISWHLWHWKSQISTKVSQLSSSATHLHSVTCSISLNFAPPIWLSGCSSFDCLIGNFSRVQLAWMQARVRSCDDSGGQSLWMPERFPTMHT